MNSLNSYEDSLPENCDVLAEGEHASFGVNGIKCDNNDCDYRDDSLKYQDYESWLNKPCPKCGENLLTEEDYQAIGEMVEAVNTLNSLTSEDIDELFSVLLDAINEGEAE